MKTRRRIVTPKERRAVVAAGKVLRRVEFGDGGLCPRCGGICHTPTCELGLAKVALLEVLMEDKGDPATPQATPGQGDGA